MKIELSYLFGDGGWAGKAKIVDATGLTVHRLHGKICTPHTVQVFGIPPFRVVPENGSYAHIQPLA